MKTGLLLLLSIVSITTVAQDYVVTRKNDTIRGQVKILTYDVIDRVEVKEGKKKTQFTAIQVRAVVKDNAIFNPVSGEGIRLMKLITPGYLSLYRAFAQATSSYETAYLVKRDGNTLAVPNLLFKRVVADYLDDCLAVREKIKSDLLTKKDLDVIVTEYNACMDSKTKAANSESSVALADPKIVAVNDLKTKIQNSSLSSQKDLNDIMNDVTGKIKNNEPVPGYLIEGLKGILKDDPQFKPELDNLLALLR